MWVAVGGAAGPDPGLWSRFRVLVGWAMMAAGAVPWCDKTRTSTKQGDYAVVLSFVTASSERSNAARLLPGSLKEFLVMLSFPFSGP